MTTRRFERRLRIVFALAALAWAVMLPLAAAAAATPHAPAGEYAFAALAYAIGGIVCHQQGARSFHLWGVQLPVCARCTGIYGGAALAVLVFAWGRIFRGRESVGRQTTRFASPSHTAAPPSDRRGAAWRSLLILSAVPIALTLVFEWTTGITPSNTIRAISGVPLGAAVAWVIVAASGSSGPPPRGDEID